MGIQMFLVHPKDNEDDGTRESIAAFIAQRGGFILMATSHGSLIAAFDDMHLEAVKGHYLVEFAGGVTLNPNAPGTVALQRLFAQNVAVQLAERGMVGSSPASADKAASASGSFPPGYRPMRWPTHTEESGGEGGD
jgi:hypothetical protein